MFACIIYFDPYNKGRGGQNLPPFSNKDGGLFGVLAVDHCIGSFVEGGLESMFLSVHCEFFQVDYVVFLT